LTYDELNRKANRLAHLLKATGVGPEVPVGLMLQRSVDMVVAILAILKAGGAYVPLDSAYPLERLDFMLKDARLQVVITAEAMLDNLPAFWGQVICIDTDTELFASASQANPTSNVTSENLAYIIYTSGSTGQPKGVSVEQRAVARLVRGANYVDLGAEEVLLQYAPVSFDASTFEVWGALLNGGKLVVMRAGEVIPQILGPGKDRPSRWSPCDSLPITRCSRSWRSRSCHGSAAARRRGSSACCSSSELLCFYSRRLPRS